jgi:hypothetical protein
MKDFPPRRRRTTLYAAFFADGTPVVNVWAWTRPRLEVVLEDRLTNEQALPGEEHIVRCTIEFYNRLADKFPAIQRVVG